MRVMRINGWHYTSPAVQFARLRISGSSFTFLCRIFVLIQPAHGDYNCIPKEIKRRYPFSRHEHLLLSHSPPWISRVLNKEAVPPEN